MHTKVLILFCATAVVISHEVEITTPTPLSEAELAYSSGPVISSYSTPAPSSYSVSNTYLPVPAISEVKTGINYKDSGAHSTYVPLHTGHSTYQSVSSYVPSFNYASPTKSAPLYTTAAPVYTTTPVTYPSYSSNYKSYPSAATYVKSTIAPSYSYSVAANPVNHVVSYPSHAYSAHGSSYYNAAVPTLAPSTYTVSPSYSGLSYSSYPSSTVAPIVSTTLGYGSSPALSYSVAPSVAPYGSSAYSIQPVPLKAQYSYAIPSQAVAYGGHGVVNTVGVPYHGGHYGYSSYSSIPQVGYGHGLNYGWKK